MKVGDTLKLFAGLQEKTRGTFFIRNIPGEVNNPDFYNQAMVFRSMGNSIFFASVNYALSNQQTTNSLISPAGERLISARPNKEELLVYDIDPNKATLKLACKTL